MKNFLAIYTGSPAALAQRPPDKATEARGMEAWGQWMAAHEKSIVDIGAPLGKTKRISADGIADIKNAMAAYVIVRAETHEEAAKMFENHPHFMIFPGDGVEIMECLPMPGL